MNISACISQIFFSGLFLYVLNLGLGLGLELNLNNVPNSDAPFFWVEIPRAEAEYTAPSLLCAL